MSKAACRVCLALLVAWCVLLVSLSRPAGEPVPTAEAIDAERLALSVEAAQARSYMLGELCLPADSEQDMETMLICARAGLHRPLAVRMMRQE